MNSQLGELSLRVAHVLPRSVLSKFSGLRLKLAKASIKTGFEVYVGLVLFVCVVSGIVAFAFSLFLLSQLGFALLTGVLLSLLVGGAVGLFSVGIGYLYPVLSAYSRGNKIDANLPFIAHFMAVLASSGMTPESVFRSLARVGKEYSVRKEVMGLIGEIELLGADLHTSLKRVSEVSPSRKFGNLLNGIITTSHMGGDLAEYLNQEAKRFKELRMGKNKRFLENLGVIAEVYVVFLVAAPLMLIIMLSVMSYIGGPLSLGSLNPNELLNLLTFVLIPIGIFFLILMVDYITPLR